MKEKTFTCYCCGNELPLEELEVEENNLQLCSSCYESEYFTCEDCGGIHHNDNMYFISDRDKYVCESCSYSYYYCEDCGEYVSSATYIEDRDYYVCDSCYDYDNYFYCESCGRYYSNDSYGGSDDYDTYCSSCYEEQCGGLLGYHCFNDWCEFKSDNEEAVPYYIGTEIELEPCGSSDVNELIDIMNNNINAVAMEDGSLNHGGAEVITHPQSWKYFKEHKQDYVNFFKEVNNLGYANMGHCGLHFHVTKPNENVISRVIVLLESFKSEIKKLSRRQDYQLRQWSKFLTDCRNNQSLKYQSTKYLKEKFLNTYHDRYMALNLTNSKTIEFRFFNGANNFEEFWSSLQFIHNLMQLALNEDLDINKIKWEYLIYGEELIAQAIKTKTYLLDKYAKDTTDIYEKILLLESNTKQDLKKVMNNFIKYVNRELNNLQLDNHSSDYNEMIEKTNNFSNEISRTCNYLSQLVRVYQSIDNREISETKWSLDTTSYHDKYQRYFKKLEKLISNYESEVNMQCA